MNLKVIMVSLVIILITHVILQKIDDMQKINNKLQEAFKQTQKQSNIKPEIEKTEKQEIDRVEKTTDNDMRQDLLNFVESSSFYEPIKSFGENKILPQETKQYDEPGFLNISKDNEVNNTIITKDSPMRDNITLKNSKYDKLSNSRVYYSTTANQKYRTIKNDHWLHKNDTITSGNVPIEGSLYAYDQNECNFAAL